MALRQYRLLESLTSYVFDTFSVSLNVSTFNRTYNIKMHQLQLFHKIEVLGTLLLGRPTFDAVGGWV